MQIQQIRKFSSEPSESTVLSDDDVIGTISQTVKVKIFWYFGILKIRSMTEKKRNGQKKTEQN